jgi:hypothetical protein
MSIMELFGIALAFVFGASCFGIVAVDLYYVIRHKHRSIFSGPSLGSSRPPYYHEFKNGNK